MAKEPPRFGIFSRIFDKIQRPNLHRAPSKKVSLRRLRTSTHKILKGLGASAEAKQFRRARWDDSIGPTRLHYLERSLSLLASNFPEEEARNAASEILNAVLVCKGQPNAQGLKGWIEVYFSQKGRGIILAE